jgi:hypothetical protein
VAEAGGELAELVEAHGEERRAAAGRQLAVDPLGETPLRVLAQEPQPHFGRQLRCPTVLEIIAQMDEVGLVQLVDGHSIDCAQGCLPGGAIAGLHVKGRQADGRYGSGRAPGGFADDGGGSLRRGGEGPAPLERFDGPELQVGCELGIERSGAIEQFDGFRISLLVGQPQT